MSRPLAGEVGNLHFSSPTRRWRHLAAAASISTIFTLSHFWGSFLL